jgi:tRNA (adenine37-N6)-methyltransferase
MPVMPNPAANPESFIYVPIGTVHTPFSDIAGMPIQPSGAQGIRGTIEIPPEFVAGL